MGMIEEVATYLTVQATSFVLGTNTFLNYMPDTPNRCRTIHEYQGVGPTFVQGPSTKAAWENPRFQVTCRSTSSTAARADIDKVFKVYNVANQTLSGTTYLRIAALQSPFLMTRDHQGRVIFACNFEVQRRL